MYGLEPIDVEVAPLRQPLRFAVAYPLEFLMFIPFTLFATGYVSRLVKEKVIRTPHKEDFIWL